MVVIARTFGPMLLALDLAAPAKRDRLALHPTVKPVAMVADAILDSSRRGNIVLDPFLGSGTTLMAAERTRRRCYGLELDPLYIDVIVRRWQTGASALHAASRLKFDEIAAARATAMGGHA
jgi:DNA modification methylase